MAFTKDAALVDFRPQSAMKTADTDSNFQELNQKMNIIINFLLSSRSEAPFRKTSLKELKSNVDQSSPDTRDRNSKSKSLIPD